MAACRHLGAGSRSRGHAARGVALNRARGRIAVTKRAGSSSRVSVPIGRSSRGAQEEESAAGIVQPCLDAVSSGRPSGRIHQQVDEDGQVAVIQEARTDGITRTGTAFRPRKNRFGRDNAAPGAS